MEEGMLVSGALSARVWTVQPHHSLADAARMMLDGEHDQGGAG
jgi:hypothetical protein